MWAMLALVVLLTTFFFGRTKKKIVPIYMAGVNAGDNLTFRGAMEKDVTVSLRNWYMEKYFGEAKMNAIGGISSAAVIVVIFSIIIGVVLMMGGVLNG